MPEKNVMKRLCAICILFIILMIGETSSAANSAGAGQMGDTILVGYDGAHLSYKEIVNDSVLDKDKGWQNGGYAELRHDDKYDFVRINFAGVGSNSSTYAGALQNGTPLTMTTPEHIYKTELDIACKAMDFHAATPAPYLGIGYRWWFRGKNALPDYEEKYDWWYGTLGANLAYRAANRLMLGLDAAMLLPMSPRMTTNSAGLTDETVFKLKSKIGVRVEAPVTYEIYRASAYTALGFLTPYYERWSTGASRTVILTSGGNTVGAAFEPRSHSELPGFKVGIGVHF